jgi:UDP-N-acetylglucosamine 4,6-dehydratase (inverting)
MRLSEKTLLITGGTGSFGHAYVDHLLLKTDIRKIIIFSRDEMKQWQMEKLYPNEGRLRFMIGDVRDRDRLYRVFRGVDYIVHAAATKIVPTAEYNPFECIKTNVNGAMNVVDAAIDCGVKRVVALSTDKASSPVNLYGASKLASDKIFISANYYSPQENSCKFSVVRYGNVIGSRGSVIPFFLNLSKSAVVPITDPRMTRFMITLQEGINLVQSALTNMLGGEIFVKKIPSMKVTDIADVICPSQTQKIVGIRPGEKLHEQMIAIEEARDTYDCGDFYAIVSNILQRVNYYYESKYPKVDDNFCYNSETNTDWMSKEKLLEFLSMSKHKFL